MARGSMKDFMMANQLVKIAESYDFPWLVCSECGKCHDSSDILKGFAVSLKRGLTEPKGK